MFPKHLLECSKTFHSQKLAATHGDLLWHMFTWELYGVDSVVCLNNKQLAAMLNFISECFSSDVPYQRGREKKKKRQKRLNSVIQFKFIFCCRCVLGRWVNLGLPSGIGFTNLAQLCLHFISSWYSKLNTHLKIMATEKGVSLNCSWLQCFVMLSSYSVNVCVPYPDYRCNFTACLLILKL